MGVIKIEVEQKLFFTRGNPPLQFLRPGIFIAFTDRTMKKAMIFTGSRYKIIPTEKLFFVTEAKMEADLEKFDVIIQSFREKKLKNAKNIQNSLKE